MDFTDKTLRCAICAEEFVFSAGEQMFYSDKQFSNEPKRCKKCRAKLGRAPGRVETSVICSECGASTIVPFLPRQGRPVLCRACFNRALRDASTRTGGTLSHDSKQVSN
jgi:CxxC-x17-CxxC domain-containing protein